MTFVRDGVRLNVSSFRDGALGASVYVFVDDVDTLHAEFVRNGVPTPLHETEYAKWSDTFRPLAAMDRVSAWFWSVVPMNGIGVAAAGAAAASVTATAPRARVRRWVRNS